ncbi:MAG: fluoride efflux transporter CrcB [Thermomicrobiaceae bacterium]
MLTILLVGVGGAIGSIARFLLSATVQRRSRSSFPWGTVVVNGTGSFLIGVAFALFDGGVYSGDALVFLASGILGGYTTFSTFSVENMALLEQRRYGWLLANTVGQISAALLFAVLGYWLGSAAV